jgi:serine/threonine-protein kinase
VLPDDPPGFGAAPDDATRLSDARAPTPSTPTTGWLSDSGSIDHGRFPPGTVLGGRYRTVGRLGRGGMGEVYRADDLKLGQPVALKFLPADVDRDPARLTQLHTEVRMARQVSHPNVCRVYDIDEVEGHTFLSMEYVDGEDLASLLRRVGRFPEDRGLEIARQVCAGLAAAHERGVVHRDFKPANVMIDGSGRARITDFGLAGVAGETIRAGTPAYMAPEQLAGGEVSARSDIYALGLVLYEIFTGRRAIEAGNFAELIRRREQEEIVPPSALTGGLSAELDRAIMRCLAPDPAARPHSALAVAAALPGGDPLAAALAAGETPSPDMVAAAGEAGVLGRRTGLALLAFSLAGLAIAAALDGRTLLVNRVAFPKSADVLEERSREVIAAAGYTAVPADTARGVQVNAEYLQWLRTSGQSSKWESLGDGTAPLLDFWYRTSPQTLAPIGMSWAPTWNDPPLATSGMITVVVDDRGRLVEFAAVPPQFDPDPPAAAAPDWAALFREAGLDVAQFSEAAPQWTPRNYGDRRTAWEGRMPQRPDVALRVEGASYRDRPVAFKVIGPWTRPSRMGADPPSGVVRAVDAFATLLLVGLMAGAVLLVYANLKSGRADRRGAGRIALFLLAVWMAAWALGARHASSPGQETGRFFSALAFALLNVGFTWLFYLALEPFVRRMAPDLLIGWTRILVGQLRDARVGRDLLVGVATGVTFVLITSADTLASLVTGTPLGQPELSNMQHFVGARYALSNMLRMIPNAMQSAMLGAFMYIVLLAIVRRRWLAGSIVFAVIAAVVLVEAGDDGLWLSLLVIALVAPLTLFVFIRFGLLAIATALATNQLLQISPLTADLSLPHAGISSVALLLVAGLAAYGFHVSRAGDGLLRRLVPQA